MNSETRACKNCKKDFVIEPDDFSFYEKLKVPPPTRCSFCRFIRKLVFINQSSLYKRKCEYCDVLIISMYHKNVPIPVWCLKCYISDAWDAPDRRQKEKFFLSKPHHPHQRPT